MEKKMLSTNQRIFSDIGNTDQIYYGKEKIFNFRYGKTREGIFVEIWLAQTDKKLYLLKTIANSIHHALEILSYFGIERGRVMMIQKKDQQMRSLGAQIYYYVNKEI
jgi:hypothetical protein